MGINGFDGRGNPLQTNFWNALEGATRIPGISTQMGRFLLNPSSITVGQLYKMYANEAVVSSAVNTTMIMLASSIGVYTHKEKRVCQVVRRMITDLGGIEVFRSMASAVWAGFYTAYKKWGVDSYGYNVVKELVAMPPTTLQPTVDVEGKLEGILQYTIYPSMNGSSWWTQGGYESQQRGSMPYPIRNYFPIYAPYVEMQRDEFLHVAFTLSGMYNPFGESLLRPAYQYYSLKSMVNTVYPLALSRATTPLLAVYADQNQLSGDAEDYGAEGDSDYLKHNPPGGNTWNQVVDMVQNIGVASSLLFPGKKGEIFDADVLRTDSNAISQFQEFLKYLDEQIRETLLIPDTSMKSGSGSGSYALGAVHDKKQKAIIQSLRATILHNFMQDVVIPVIQANFGELDDYGSFIPVADDIDTKLKLAALAEQNARAGVSNSMTDLDDHNFYRTQQGMWENDKLPEWQTELQGNKLNMENTKEHYKNGGKNGY